jgi:ubiquinone/menaquinone biosynthesis C-methylase UbiE
MDWHRRYLQQAQWTRDLRAYVFKQAGLNRASVILEVGCGTGAILAELPDHALLHGLDIDPAGLAQCRFHAPSAILVQDVCFLFEKSFDMSIVIFSCSG